MLINAKILVDSQIFGLSEEPVNAVFFKKGCRYLPGRAAFGIEEMREMSKALRFFFCSFPQAILTRTPLLWTIGVWGFGNAWQKSPVT